MELDIRYVAGLIDADGWITINKWRPKPNNTSGYDKAYVRYQLYVGCAQVHYPLIKQLQDQFGGLLHRQASAYNRDPERNRIAYQWRLCSREAADFLGQVLPWLVVKLPQAELGIDVDQAQDKETEQLQYVTHLIADE